MKKFLVLALVLSMATMASAGIVFQTAVTEVRPSDVITINLITTAGELVNGLDIGAITDGGKGGLASAPLTLNSNFNTINDPGVLVNAGGILVKWITGNAGIGVFATGTLYSFQYHVPNLPASTFITIQDYSADPYWLPIVTYGGVDHEGHLGAVVLHITPEPMTMGLLGLGGLFLRRRSK